MLIINLIIKLIAGTNLGIFVFVTFFCRSGFPAIKAQINDYIPNFEDSTSLEDVIVEKYYVADSADCADTTGGILPLGSVTYRIYIDLKQGYFLQVVYGNEKHELFLKTSTTFFNNTYIYGFTGRNIDFNEINNNSVALDSWITLVAAANRLAGIPIADDRDGSIIKRVRLNKSDGLTEGNTPTLQQFNLNLTPFYTDTVAAYFHTTNGGWAALEGARGPTPDNKILIAQLTTNGTLSFALNIQVGTPGKGVVNFVAENPTGSEIGFKGLKY